MSKHRKLMTNAEFLMDNQTLFAESAGEGVCLDCQRRISITK